MNETSLVLVGLVFLVAGVVKGVVGLGLPTISMGLLATMMPPLQAAAILLLPSFVTNLWQMLAGPKLIVVIRRLWSMMLAVCFGTWAGLGLMTGASAKYGTAFLGLALCVYAITGLAAWRPPALTKWEIWLSPAVGAITGIITAATGVFVIPAVPYLQAIGLEKDELVQALGLSFTVSTLALAVNVVSEVGYQFSAGLETVAALAFACAGMWLGQSLRLRLSPSTFRKWFFISLLLLGMHLVIRSGL